MKVYLVCDIGYWDYSMSTHKAIFKNEEEAKKHFNYLIGLAKQDFCDNDRIEQYIEENYYEAEDIDECWFTKISIEEIEVQ